VPPSLASLLLLLFTLQIVLSDPSEHSPSASLPLTSGAMLFSFHDCYSVFPHISLVGHRGTMANNFEEKYNFFESYELSSGSLEGGIKMEILKKS